jgi:hypothetical protein
MLLNILYYDQVAEAKANTNTGNSLAFGPLYITPEQVRLINLIYLKVIFYK